MRATEILRGLLDLIDNLDNSQDMSTDDCGCGNSCDCPECQSTLANSPDTVFATVDMITKDAGGGVNGPKHPADLKTSTFPLYPGLQFKE